MLINAVKELHSQNEELKKQVEVQDKNFHYLLNEIQNLKSILESK
jgi:chaperonin cofactor prefoldin